jgi:hypothetical protein
MGIESFAVLNPTIERRVEKLCNEEGNDGVHVDRMSDMNGRPQGRHVLDLRGQLHDVADVFEADLAVDVDEVSACGSAIDP